MNSVIVRPMTPDDIPVVALWMVQVPLWQRYGLIASAMHNQLEVALNRQDITLVADQNVVNRAVGFAWCLPQGLFGRSAYLKLIGVRSDQARSGVGSTLLEAVERAAIKHNSDLFLLVSDFNMDAQRFYERHAYRQVGAIPAYVLPDVTELLYWKQLRNPLKGRLPTQ